MAYTLSSGAPTSKLIIINSEDADDYLDISPSTGEFLTSSFIWNMDVGLTIDNERFDTLLSLNSAVIPRSWWTIRTNVNDECPFWIGNASDPTNAVLTSVIIPGGVYTATSLLDALAKRMAEACATAGFPGVIFSFLYSRVKLMDVFGFKTAGVPPLSANDILVRFDFRTSVSTTTIRKFLGFKQEEQPWFQINNSGLISASRESGLTVTGRDPELNLYLLATNACDMAAVHALYIHCSLAQDNCIDSGNGGYSDIIARCSITTNPGGIVFFQPSDGLAFKAKINISNIKSIRMSITTEDSREKIDLQGLPWQCALQVDLVPKMSVPRSLTRGERQSRRPSQLPIDPNTVARLEKGLPLQQIKNGSLIKNRNKSRSEIIRRSSKGRSKKDRNARSRSSGKAGDETYGPVSASDGIKIGDTGSGTAAGVEG
tara:strand:+ start:374 stop:1663 length:1290 start_codon:yes stop_codon:yes gene_type:complete